MGEPISKPAASEAPDDRGAAPSSSRLEGRTFAASPHAPAASGTLAQRPLAHLLIYSRGRGLTGSLELRTKGGAAALFTLVGGQIAKVDTSEPVAFLGRVLFELGTIDDVTLGETLTELAVSRRLHGGLLLERGKVTAEELHAGLRVLREQKALSVFDFPPETTFAFYPQVDRLPNRPHDVPPADVLPLIWRALRDAPPPAHLNPTLSRLGPYAMRVGSRTPLGLLGLRDGERELAECLRLKALTLPELVAAGFLPKMATQVLVYFLMITKTVELVEREDALAPSSMRTLVEETPRTAPPAAAATSAFGSGQYTRPISFALSQPPIAAEERGARAIAPSDSPAPWSSRPPQARISGAPAAGPPSGAFSSSAPALDGGSGSLTPPPSGTSEVNFRRQLTERARSLEADDYFKVLGVERDVTAEEAEAAFAQLVATVHPDSLPPALADLRKECVRLIAKATAARDALTDPVLRRTYEETLGARVQEAAEADAAFAQAEMNVIIGDHAKAEQHCRRALSLAPSRSEAAALLAWLEAQDPRKKSQEHARGKIVALERILDADPACRRAQYYRASLLKRVGDDEGAMLALRRALEADPDDADAQRELRIYEKRIEAGTLRLSRGPGRPGRGASGLFDKLRRK